jgi:hypothetical protein
MSTRQTAWLAPPCVGEASVVITALGVSVLRVSAWLIYGIEKAPKIDNMVVYMVNLVVDRVN